MTRRAMASVTWWAAASSRGEILVSTLANGVGERYEGRALAPNEGLVIRLD